MFCFTRLYRTTFAVLYIQSQNQAKRHSMHWVRGPTVAGEDMGGRRQVGWSDFHPASALHLLNSWPGEDSDLLRSIVDRGGFGRALQRLCGRLLL